MTQSQPDKVTPLRPRRPCPECNKPSERSFYPFCSKRCKEVDLNRWLSGSYAIPGRAIDEEDGDPA
ncbi:DNA gyrase inhibitor YacG [Nitratireductor sp. GISD-1A_MAKvit]|uniref:DNA gyrase inhibitor YacG n=1 Tax=Nitratireductor sp. GISD-1A_MAKvit TaxID=3234198 RepID=UPI0034667547